MIADRCASDSRGCLCLQPSEICIYIMHILSLYKPLFLKKAHISIMGAPLCPPPELPAVIDASSPPISCVANYHTLKSLSEVLFPVSFVRQADLYHHHPQFEKHYLIDHRLVRIDRRVRKHGLAGIAIS